MRMLAALAVAVLATTLAGCGPGRAADAPAPQTTVTAEPLFATDAEALAAAEKVYREYSELARAISYDGGNDPERLIPITTSSWFEQEQETYRRVQASGQRATGKTPLISFVLQERRE